MAPHDMAEWHTPSASAEMTFNGGHASDSEWPKRACLRASWLAGEEEEKREEAGRGEWKETRGGEGK